MRIWVPISIAQFETFDRSGSLEVSTGYALTRQFAQAQADPDEEVLESQILEIAGAQNPMVLVVEAPANELPGSGGEVSLTQSISQPQIQAFFAATAQEPDEMLWFGPSERPEIRGFLGLDVGSK